MGITVNLCPNCRVTVENGQVKWQCDDYHPEVLAWLADLDKEKATQHEAEPPTDKQEPTVF